ncbi:MAG TPA: ABC transporter permease subunit [Polyangiaceae bacterium]|jgi:ABC-type dipeptide/oligopeptide/nickel transport system permease component|nr:ABC transporter permease subunit [Polyangiaceae bacterium]
MGAVTVLAFWLLARALDGDARQSQDDGARSDAQLPLFVNLEPRGVREIVWDAAESIAKDAEQRSSDESTSDGRERDELAPLVRARADAVLQMIGGAGLPYLLPRLDALSPVGRAAVAEALLPVAVRMGIASSALAYTPAEASELWARFSVERLGDFKPAAARRAVSRYALKATDLRSNELFELDTFALEELFRQQAELLDPGATSDEARDPVATASRLMTAAARLLGKDWVLAPGASLEQARELNQRWQNHWALVRSNFVVLQGVERLVAPFFQTRYAAWARQCVVTRFGVLNDGQSALGALRSRSPNTIFLFLVGLVGGTFLGIVIGQLAAASKRFRGRRIRLLAKSATFVLPVLLLQARHLQSVTLRTVAGCSLMLLIGGLLVVRQQAANREAQRNHGWIFAYRILGASPLLAAWRTLRISSNLAISALAPQSSTLLTCVFVVEFAFGLDGIGPTTIAALKARDPSWIILVTVATTCLVGAVHLASDVLLARLDPRRSYSLHDEG